MFFNMHFNLMKGIEKLRAKLPDYLGKKMYKFLVLSGIVFFCSLTFQFIIDSFFCENEGF